MGDTCRLFDIKLIHVPALIVSVPKTFLYRDTKQKCSQCNPTDASSKKKNRLVQTDEICSRQIKQTTVNRLCHLKG